MFLDTFDLSVGFKMQVNPSGLHIIDVRNPLGNDTEDYDQRFITKML